MNRCFACGSSEVTRACDHCDKAAFCARESCVDRGWPLHATVCSGFVRVSSPSVTVMHVARDSLENPHEVPLISTVSANAAGYLEYNPVLLRRERLNPFSSEGSTNYRGRQLEPGSGNYYTDPKGGYGTLTMEIKVRKQGEEGGITSVLRAEVPRDLVADYRGNYRVAQNETARKLALLRRWRLDDEKLVVYFHDRKRGEESNEYAFPTEGCSVDVTVTKNWIGEGDETNRTYTLSAILSRREIKRFAFGRLSPTARRELQIKGASGDAFILEAVDPETGFAVRFACERQTNNRSYIYWHHGVEVMLPTEPGSRKINTQIVPFTCDTRDHRQLAALCYAVHHHGLTEQLREHVDTLERHLRRADVDQRRVNIAAEICLDAAFRHVEGLGSARSLAAKTDRELLTVYKPRWMQQLDDLMPSEEKKGGVKSYFSESVRRVRLKNARRKLENLAKELERRASKYRQYGNDGAADNIANAVSEIRRKLQMG